MINREHTTLSLTQQCALIGLNRSTLYYKPCTDNGDDLVLKELIDRQFLEAPYFGSRKLTEILRRQGYRVNRKRVRRLMREMGLAVIWRQPNTSKPNPEHKIYPYLLRRLTPDPIRGRPAEPEPAPDPIGGVVCRRDRHPDAQGLSLSGRGDGLGEPAPGSRPRGAGLAAVEHARRRFLRRGPARGVGPLRATRHL